MTIGTYWSAFALLLVLLDLPQLRAGPMINYQGRIYNSGSLVSGEGLFAFAILDSNGVILWASGEFPDERSSRLPAGALKTKIAKGLYTVKLGEASRGMPPLDLELVRRSPAPKLRIWFSDGVHHWSHAGDVPLASVLGISDDSSGSLTASQTGAILQELKDLRARLDRQGQANPPSRPPAPAEPLTGTVPLGPGPTLGKPDAPLVLVEFTDYQCPYCKRFDETVMTELKKNFVDSGQLRIVSHNLPLSFHSNAEGAALAALCADQQKQYWPMREKLFANSAALLATNLFKAAAELKLDLTAFQSCLEGKIFAGQIKKESEEAAAVGITGTPSFVIGKEAQGKVTGVIVVGAQPYATFESQIKKLLATAK